MSMNDLVTQEEELIVEKFLLKQKLINAEFKEKEWEIKLWTETDFAKKGLKNAEQRKAYVKGEMAKFIKRSDMYKNELELCENCLKSVRFKKQVLLENYPEEAKGIDFPLNKLVEALSEAEEGEIHIRGQLESLINEISG